MKFEVFELETKSISGVLTVVAMTYSDNSKICFLHVNNDLQVVETMCNAFSSSKIYYNHNLTFTFFLIIKPILSNLKFSWVYTNDILYGVDIFFKRKTVYLRCSYRLIPLPLEKFYPKLSQKRKLYFDSSKLSDWDYWRSKPFNSSSLRDWESFLEEYCRQSISILKEGLLVFWLETAKLGIVLSKKIYSLGGVAMSFFLKNYNNINLSLDPKWEKIAKSAYFGGRCEVFGNLLDDEIILHYDFKGMYQQCMLESLPVGNFELQTCDLSVKKPGFHLISIDYSLHYPILPLKESKLYFKDGRVFGWYWFEEIKLALKHGNIAYFKVISSLVSTDYYPALNDFVTRLGKLRDDEILDKDVGKLIINSFYGRLAFSNPYTTVRCVKTVDKSQNFGIVNSVYLVKEEKFLRRKANIAVAAAITAKARIKLYNAFVVIENYGGRLLYCDTDSIFVAFKKSKYLDVLNKDLGGVFFDKAKQDTIIVDAVFAGPKTYAVKLKSGETHVKIKGFSENSIGFDEFKTNFYSDKLLTQNVSTFCKKNLNITAVLTPKELNLSSYDKRQWLANKKKTKPLKSNMVLLD